jgi:hypothetical protein
VRPVFPQTEIHGNDCGQFLEVEAHEKPRKYCEPTDTEKRIQIEYKKRKPRRWCPAAPGFDYMYYQQNRQANLRQKNLHGLSQTGSKSTRIQLDGSVEISPNRIILVDGVSIRIEL